MFFFWKNNILRKPFFVIFSAKKMPHSKKHKTATKKQQEQNKITTSPTKKRKTAEEKQEELSIPWQTLANLEDNILPQPIDSVSVGDSSDSESDWSDSEDESLVKTSLHRSSSSTLQHPHFGGKTPKVHHPPSRSINVYCKQKCKKDDEIHLLKEEVQHLNEELRKY